MPIYDKASIGAAILVKEESVNKMKKKLSQTFQVYSNFNFPGFPWFSRVG